MSNPNRDPRGIPTGGQFAAGKRGEGGDVALGSAPSLPDDLASVARAYAGRSQRLGGQPVPAHHLASALAAPSPAVRSALERHDAFVEQGRDDMAEQSLDEAARLLARQGESRALDESLRTHPRFDEGLDAVQVVVGDHDLYPVEPGQVDIIKHSQDISDHLTQGSLSDKTRKEFESLLANLDDPSVESHASDVLHGAVSDLELKPEAE